MPTKTELNKLLDDAQEALEQGTKDLEVMTIRAKEAEAVAGRLRMEAGNTDNAAIQARLKEANTELLARAEGAEAQCQVYEDRGAVRRDGGHVYVRWCHHGHVPGGVVSAGMVQRNPSMDSRGKVAHVVISSAIYEASPTKFVPGFQKPRLTVLPLGG